MRIVHAGAGLSMLAVLGLVSCGGSHSSTSAAGVASDGTGYSVGGTISGLSAGGLLLANGKDTQTEGSSTTSFTFPTLVPTGAAYDVTVTQQPSGQTCQVTGGTGTMGTAAVTTVAVTCGLWDWVNGSDTPGAAGVYGTMGQRAQAAPYNTPGARAGAATWTDSSRNFWMFGGGDDTPHGGGTEQFNDLWECSPAECSPAENEGWTWVSGSSSPNATGAYGAQGVAAAANVPGARTGATSWIDSANNLWLFGGESEDSATGTVIQFNDLWVFNPQLNGGEWTWVSGSSSPNATGMYGQQGVSAAANVPGARASAVSWIDSSGNLWLFGGYCYSETNGIVGNCVGAFNDLWKFTPSVPCTFSPCAPSATGTWTWVSGSSSPNATAFYGTQGVAAAGNVPGARNGAYSWIDTSGNFWLFGGNNVTASIASGTTDLDDLWKFDPSSAEWTWIGGSSAPGAPTVYGSQGVAAAANTPGARDSGNAWTDNAGNFWLFGGELTSFTNSTATSAFYGDLWEYSTASGQWTWVSGSTTTNAPANYGTQGTPALSNVPGGRAQASSWTDGFGTPWLFGGYAVDPANNAEFFNDLWHYEGTPTIAQ